MGSTGIGEERRQGELEKESGSGGQQWSVQQKSQQLGKWRPYLGMWECVLSGKWLQGSGNRNQNNGGLVSRRPGNRKQERLAGLRESGKDVGWTLQGRWP